MVGPSLVHPRFRLPVTGCAPVDEPHAHLETGVALAHPLLFGQSKEVEERPVQVRHRRLAHPDPRNGRRFQHRDGDLGAERLAEIGGGHPARRTAAEDDDLLDPVVHRDRPFVSRSTS